MLKKPMLFSHAMPWNRQAPFSEWCVGDYWGKKPFKTLKYYPSLINHMLQIALLPIPMNRFQQTHCAVPKRERHLLISCIVHLICQCLITCMRPMSAPRASKAGALQDCSWKTRWGIRLRDTRTVRAAPHQSRPPTRAVKRRTMPPYTA